MEKDELALEIEEEEVRRYRLWESSYFCYVLTAHNLSHILWIHLPIQEGEIEYVEGDDIEMGDMDDMEDFEGFGDEDGKHFPCFYWF